MRLLDHPAISGLWAKHLEPASINVWQPVKHFARTKLLTTSPKAANYSYHFRTVKSGRGLG